MQRQPDHQHRKVIPRWREVKRTPTEELLSATVSRPVQPNNLQRHGFAAARTRWVRTPSVEAAGELIQFAAHAPDDLELRRAAQFLSENADARPFLRETSRAYLGETGGDVEVNQCFQIATLKSRLREFPRNGILHVELARLYTALGQTKPAERHFQQAVALWPENRFIVRSAARFFVHEEEFGEAAALFNKSGSSDPWLLASQVAVFHLAGWQSFIPIKKARGLLELAHSPSQVSELASALGTLEMEEGSRRRANKLFRMSGEAPNDNAVAQLRWAHDEYSIAFEPRLLRTALSFEARAGDAYGKKEWELSVAEAWNWLRDEPFSTRPAQLGSFVAAAFLRDHAQAIRFALESLKANPDDVTLRNNLAYSAACLGQMKTAEIELATAKRLAASESSNIVLTATEAFVKLQMGELEEGNRLYGLALEQAIEKGRPEYAQSVMLHWMNANPVIIRVLPDGHRNLIMKHFGESGKAAEFLKEFYRINLAEAFHQVREAESAELSVEQLGPISKWIEHS